MNKSKWVESAVHYMRSLTGPWENEDNLKDYCESLYESYVEDMSDSPCSPKDAVDEDMTYWDAE